VNHGPAVFWKLKDLEPGDLVEVQLRDGTVIRYEVTASHSYAVAEMPMAEILAPTAVESVTLITCTGTFSGGEYSHRLVVRAAKTGVVRAG
jgi:LPXTG-site transpeptidase (sortase) family protein